MAASGWDVHVMALDYQAAGYLVVSITASATHVTYIATVIKCTDKVSLN